jgi:hypothetical protein
MHLPIQVQSCWNGIAVLDPAPFYSPPYIKFRMARLAEEECSASECSLICNDYWEAGYGRIMMVPRVKLAYDKVRYKEVEIQYMTDRFFYRKCLISFILQDGTLLPFEGLFVLGVFRTIRGQTHRTGRGLVLMTGCSRRRRAMK